MRPAWWVLGVAAAVVATVGPVDAVADRSIAGHMAQHLILVMVAALAFARGEPMRGVMRVVGPGRRGRRLGRLLRRCRAFATSNLGVALATATFLMVMTIWHVPALYDAATAHPPVHLLEHASLLIAATGFWYPVVRPSRRDRVAPLVAVVASAVHATVLALVLIVAPRPLYSRPPEAGPSWDGRGDQAAAGAILWGLGGALTVAVLAWAVGSLVSRTGGSDEQRTRVVRRDDGPHGLGSMEAGDSAKSIRPTGTVDARNEALAGPGHRSPCR